MFQRILVAIDGTSSSSQALKAAIDMAREQKAGLDVLHVVEATDAFAFYVDGMPLATARYWDDIVETSLARGRQVVDKALASAKAKGVRGAGHVVQIGAMSVADNVLRCARKLRSDLIVLGTHGRRGMRRLVMGSDAETVVREARVPVLLVRAGTRRNAPRIVRHRLRSKRSSMPMPARRARATM